MFFALKESLNIIDNTVNGLIYITLIGIFLYTSILLLTNDELAYLFIKAFKEKYFLKEEKT
jgi:hypothetical protein